ncbi:MAG: NAD(P)H-hydrate dehydratase [Selenomonadaceae bacterium]|nr:NAD(P)H-hydrate dehydratase [Selenomonadaceae bacterium]
MKIALANQMRDIDKNVIENYGLPELSLMESAGHRVAQAVRRVLKSVAKKSICIAAGSGNNGGDALTAARYLSNLGARSKVFILEGKSGRSESLDVQMRVLRAMGVEIQILDSDRAWERMQVQMRFADAVIDGLLGTGFSGQLRPSALRLIRLINSAGKPVIAIDVPSGVDADTGQIGEAAIKAVCTVALGLPKVGHYICPGASLAGEVLIDDIGLPSQLLSNDIHQTLIDDELAITLMPERPRDVHKGSCGKLLVVAGSRGLTGAAALSSMAALKAGAGLVTLAAAESLNSIFEVKLTEVMTAPIVEVRAGILGGDNAVSQILDLADKCDALLIGPGLGREKETCALVRKLVTAVDKPLVLDADGIFAFNGRIEELKECKQIPILTPHLGELSALLGLTVDELRKDLVSAVRMAAQDYRVVLVAKCETTLVAYPNGEVFISPLGNAGMATGGVGDVLSGTIAGLLKLTPFAPLAGVYLHGTAGDMAFEQRTEGLIASDVLENIPEALKKLRGLQSI